MEQFFTLIYGDLEGHVAIVTRDESGNLTDEKWFLYPADKDRMIKYATHRADEDIYTTVAVFSQPSRSKLDTKAMSHTVYADADTCHPDNFRLPPTIVVKTSPDRYHCYWVLDEYVSADKSAQASQRIYLAHKDEGCDAGWAVSKLLRVPDTTNLKRKEPYSLETEYFTENLYPLDTFEAVYNDVTPVTFDIVSENLPETVTAEEFALLEAVVEDAGLSALYYERPTDEQSWYELLFRLELDLFREGLSAREVFWIASQAACNKYARDGRSPEDLWKDVQKAFNVFVDDEDVEVPTNPEGTEVKRSEFLTLSERKVLRENPCFVDDYLAWVTPKTDAAEVYHHSLAYVLLSQVFGGRGKLIYAFEPMQLNLWVTIAGDTTLTRKSTAKGLMLSVLHEFEKQAALDVPIDIGQDSTSEGVVSVLGKEERDGKAAMLIIDEFQGWISSAMTKNHMAGTLDRFTDLYGGKVPVVIRATQGAGNNRRNETSFSLVGVGIRETFGRVLTKEHFASGFLARMLWAVADTPPYSDRFGMVPWRDESADAEKASYDPVRDVLVKKLKKSALKFPYNKERVITFSDEAKKRIEEWTVPLTKTTYYASNSDVIYPTTDRLKYSVMKSAALLAMYEQRSVVELIDVLHALAQAELWYRDMIRMASEISSSDYESKLDEVERYIASGEDGKRRDVSIRKQFARYRASEYDDIITSLKKQGRVRNDPQDRKVLQALS